MQLNWLWIISNCVCDNVYVGNGSKNPINAVVLGSSYNYQYTVASNFP